MTTICTSPSTIARFSRSHAYGLGRCASGVALALVLVAGMASAQTGTPEQYRIEWLGRPWELRYILYVTSSWSSESASARQLTEQAEPNKLYRYWRWLFEPTAFYPSQATQAGPDQGLTVVLMEFDRDGKLLSPHRYEAPLYGRIDRLLYVHLTPGDPDQPYFSLGEWFTGLGDVSTHWAPGLCDSRQMPSPFSSTDTGYLYGPSYTKRVFKPTVGCREWAYQLEDSGRPYIDITSHYSRKADPQGPRTYVRGILGWAYFSRDPKPVIGKHANDWFCLHECPDGEAPGRIEDIQAWAQRRGWPMPQPPTRVPVFPDPPAKEGRYP